MHVNVCLRLIALLVFASLASAKEFPAHAIGPRLGLQSWTCRDLTFEQTVDIAAKHGVKYVQFTAAALDIQKSSREELLRKKAYIEKRGLVAYAFGVNHASVDKEANRRLFEIAKLFGMKLLVVEPRDPAAWDGLEELVREYDIRLAIHNHGAGTVYGIPEDVKRVLAARDPRIGVCLDIGWITAAGFDAARVFKNYGDRVFDIHFKDRVVEKGLDAKPVSRDALLGTGQANYKALFAEIVRTDWSGVMAIESDSRDIRQSNDIMIAAAKEFYQQSLVASPTPSP